MTLVGIDGLSCIDLLNFKFTAADPVATTAYTGGDLDHPTNKGACL
jgi:hypothetical protein